jgi:hypothetical protein
MTARPKENTYRSEPYRRLVAALPCVHCGIEGYSQAAHPNTGKGGMLKTDDRLCFPLCHDGSPNRCHPRFDQGAMFSKAARRLIEPGYASWTQVLLRARALSDPSIRRVVEATIGM